MPSGLEKLNNSYKLAVVDLVLCFYKNIFFEKNAIKY